MSFLLRVLLITCLLGALPVQAAVYRWVDENGRTHFSDRAPAQGAFEVQGVEPAAGEQVAEEPADLPPPAVAPQVDVDAGSLLASLIADIRPGTPGVTDLFFLGFAGDAKQGVFMRETLYAKKLFEQQYDAEGRAFALVNHQDTESSLPHANVENLGEMLRALGKAMDDEDVLYLYLTSHGSKEHQLVIDFPSYHYSWLSAPKLRKLLEASGIRYRVLVISACYSGGFIPSLRNPTTVVATAADAQNTSFGCSDANDFTWFGKAIFEQQMAHGVGILPALDEARDIVREMEIEANYEHSNPQLVIGSEIRKVVETLVPRAIASGQ